jgi:hypothetical protein
VRGKKGRARPEVEGGADRWAPPVGDRVREREGREAERVAWAETEVGRELGWVGLAVFFSFLFKSNFKPISNLLNSNLFHLLKF